MNPHNQLLHDVYQLAKWRIIKAENSFACYDIENVITEAGHDFSLTASSLQNFRLFFKHLANYSSWPLYWPLLDKLSRIKALDVMISLCKKNQL